MCVLVCLLVFVLVFCVAALCCACFCSVVLLEYMHALVLAFEFAVLPAKQSASRNGSVETRRHE